MCTEITIPTRYTTTCKWSWCVGASCSISTVSIVCCAFIYVWNVMNLITPGKSTNSYHIRFGEFKLINLLLFDIFVDILVYLTSLYKNLAKIHDYQALQRIPGDLWVIYLLQWLVPYAVYVFNSGLSEIDENNAPWQAREWYFWA